MVLSQDKEEIRDNTSVYRGFLMQYCAKMAILRRFITMVHRPSADSLLIKHYFYNFLVGGLHSYPADMADCAYRFAGIALQNTRI